MAPATAQQQAAQQASALASPVPDADPAPALIDALQSAHSTLRVAAQTSKRAQNAYRRRTRELTAEMERLEKTCADLGIALDSTQIERDQSDERKERNRDA